MFGVSAHDRLSTIFASQISAKSLRHPEWIVKCVSMAFLRSSAKEWQDYKDWQALAAPILRHCSDRRWKNPPAFRHDHLWSNLGISAILRGLTDWRRQRRRCQERGHARQNQTQNRQLRAPAGYLRQYPMN